MRSHENYAADITAITRRFDDPNAAAVSFDEIRELCPKVDTNPAYKAEILEGWLKDPKTPAVSLEQLGSLVNDQSFLDRQKRPIIAAWVEHPNTAAFSLEDFRKHLYDDKFSVYSEAEVFGNWLSSPKTTPVAVEELPTYLEGLRSRWDKGAVAMAWLTHPKTAPVAKEDFDALLRSTGDTRGIAVLLGEHVKNEGLPPVSLELLQRNVMPHVEKDNQAHVLATWLKSPRTDALSAEEFAVVLEGIEPGKGKDALIDIWCKHPKTKGVTVAALQEHILPHVSGSSLKFDIALQCVGEDQGQWLQALCDDMPYLVQSQTLALRRQKDVLEAFQEEGTLVSMGHVCTYLQEHMAAIPPVVVGTAYPLSFEGTAMADLPAGQKARLRSRFNTLLSAAEPTQEQVVGFFKAILPIDEEAASTLDQHAAKLKEVFVGQKAAIVALFGCEGGLEKFSTACATALGDGCVANIGTQLKLAVYNAMAPNEATAALLGFYVTNIMQPVFETSQWDMLGGHHGGANILGDSMIMRLQASPVGLVPHLAHEFCSHDGQIKRDPWPLIREKLGDEKVEKVMGEMAPERFNLEAAELAAFLTVREIPGIAHSQHFQQHYRGLVEKLELGEVVLRDPTYISPQPQQETSAVGGGFVLPPALRERDSGANDIDTVVPSPISVAGERSGFSRDLMHALAGIASGQDQGLAHDTAEQQMRALEEEFLGRDVVEPIAEAPGQQPPAPTPASDVLIPEHAAALNPATHGPEQDPIHHPDVDFPTLPEASIPLQQPQAVPAEVAPLRGSPLPEQQATQAPQNAVQGAERGFANRVTEERARLASGSPQAPSR